MNASKILGLDKVTAEELANSAGLSNEYIGGPLIDNLGYSGKIIELCRKAMISDRMLRIYNHKHPTKQTVIALAIAANKSCDEIDSLLHKYGYCLSDSVVSDVVIKWHINHYKAASNSTQMLDEINDTLEKMGLPLLMTRQ